MYDWDNDMTEDAKFAVSTGFVFRHLPTSQDAAMEFLLMDVQRLHFKLGSSHDLWESTRIVSKLTSDFGLIGNIYFGNANK
jgi:hypothetical protein